MPRGMSLSRPASHCPQCGHPIRWYHNIPVLGWLVLRGRCADCHRPIPGFYPLVEATVALFFLFVMIWQIPAFNDAVQQAMPNDTTDLTQTEFPLQTADLPYFPNRSPDVSRHTSDTDMTSNAGNTADTNRDEPRVPSWQPLLRVTAKSVIFSLIPTLSLILWLIHRDRQPIPRRLWIFGLLVLLCGVWLY